MTAKVKRNNGALPSKKGVISIVSSVAATTKIAIVRYRRPAPGETRAILEMILRQVPAYRAGTGGGGPVR